MLFIYPEFHYYIVSFFDLKTKKIIKKKFYTIEQAIKYYNKKKGVKD